MTDTTGELDLFEETSKKIGRMVRFSEETTVPSSIRYDPDTQLPTEVPLRVVVEGEAGGFYVDYGMDPPIVTIQLTGYGQVDAALTELLPPPYVQDPEERLFGLPGAERLDFGPEEVWESHVEADDLTPMKIEEWTVVSQANLLPSAETILDHMLEHWVAEEVIEEVWESWDYAQRLPDVVAAFRRAMDLLATKVTGRMADKRIAVHTVTYTDEGEPLYDGEPFFPNWAEDRARDSPSPE